MQVFYAEHGIPFSYAALALSVSPIPMAAAPNREYPLGHSGLISTTCGNTRVSL